MPDLFEAASERLALATGLPKSQALLRVRGLDATPSGPLVGVKSGAARDLSNAKRCADCSGIIAGSLSRCFPCARAAKVGAA